MSNNIPDLDSLIPNEDIRKLFKSSYIYINSHQAIQDCIRKTIESKEGCLCLMFDKSFLKYEYFDELKYYLSDEVSIVNCNSDIKIFEEILLDGKKTLVFNNIAKCNNKMFEYIKEQKRAIIVC